MSHLWLPFTQMGAFDASERTFIRAHGTSLTDSRGRTVFDAVSSIWTTIHGHGHPAIVDAIARQAAVLDHATALGATNPVAEALAARLSALSGLDVAFFAADGASAIEAALKIALQYWRLVGEPQRTRIAHLVSSYHGDTTGAMSVSDIAVFKRHFSPLVFDAIAFEDAAPVLARNDVAAILVEPLVQASAGMRIVGAQRYELLRGPRTPLLILDEIATGFGRTGTLFAFEQLDLEPDLLCLGKGLSGGSLALSATLATRQIYDAFIGAPSAQRQFFHGHSYAGNPIACAAALASLDLFELERTLEHVAELDTALDSLLAPLEHHPRVREIRRVGLMCGIELVPAASSDGTTHGARVAEALYRKGHFTRAIGDVVQLVPPLSSSVAELGAFAASVAGVLDE